LKNIEYLKFGSHQLDNRTALHVRGDFDAVIQLLQGQVTSDCKMVSMGRGQPSALCDEKGYVLCNFDILIHEDKVLIIINVEFQDIFIKELSKFAPFFKVSIEPYQTKVIGWIRHSKEKTAENEHIIMQSEGVHMTLAITIDDQQDNSKVQQEDPDWAIGRKLFGDYLIGPKDQGVFRPHELNQNINRVSFSKGCFRGQEIIARMEYLGKKKTQTQLIIHSDLEDVSAFKVIGKTPESNGQFFSSCLGAKELFKNFT
jgi:folate-binding protein YgfZ